MRRRTNSRRRNNLRQRRIQYARNENNMIDEGRLQVDVFSERRANPLENATVRISAANDTGRTVDELGTNASGQTATVDLAAPPVEYSMNPEQPSQPFSTYNVTVDKPGYKQTRVNNVQIFPGTEAIQDVIMVPAEEEISQEQVININDPTLWGNFPEKIPEAEVKDLPKEDNFVVLPEPVIPEFIVVHAGRPEDTSAQNYWIPFKDYIKNVGSCEIYANWPEESLRANILAILSFTLNRVYTEWYRSRGYNFTITNSTAFDQAFTYGRNIFEQISVIVDEIFTSFITRPNIRQPLFTQYCDGQQRACPGWMTQWGSKALGDQGYVAIDILKNFYGSDIFLMQAKKVEGVPVSFPGVVLQVGSTGQYVRMIQEQINAISNKYPAIGKVPVNGVYDEATRASVETFQSVFRLPSNGIVDFATWYKLSQIFVAVEGLA